MDASVEQLTKEQAIAFAKSGVWKDWDSDKITRFQLFQNKLCMDFEAFHKAVEQTLGRPVYTHEFANADALRSEYLGTRQAPTLQEIIDMIPAKKRIMIGI